MLGNRLLKYFDDMFTGVVNLFRERVVSYFLLKTKFGKFKCFAIIIVSKTDIRYITHVIIC